MIDLKTVKEIRISEGSVTKITNSSGVVLWQKATGSSASIDVDLNNQWIDSTKTLDGYKVYMSNSNHNVDNGYASMKFKFKGMPDFKLWINSYAESNYDYTIAWNMDVNYPSSNPSSTTPGIKASTSGKQYDPTNITAFTEVDYPNDGGEHFVVVTYKKDSSVNANDDRGYVAVKLTLISTTWVVSSTEFIKKDGKYYEKLTEVNTYEGGVTANTGNYKEGNELPVTTKQGPADDYMVTDGKMYYKNYIYVTPKDQELNTGDYIQGDYIGEATPAMKVTYTDNTEKTFYNLTSIEEYTDSNKANAKNVVIYDSVTTIGWVAFDGCSKLESATIPNSVTNIKSYAFRGCSKLSSITIPDSVTKYGDYLFQNCTNLTEVTIGSGATDMGYASYSGCTSLKTMTVKATTPPSLVEGTIPTTIQTIYVPSDSVNDYKSNREEYDDGWYGWSNFASKIKAIPIPAMKVTYVDGTEKTFNNLTSIDENTDANKANAKNVILYDGVTSIGDKAFYGCSSLTDITIPNSVTEIGNNAFNGCSGLISVTLPNGITKIGDDAFYNCSSLTGVAIPDSVTIIGDSAFRGCSAITGITIPNGVMVIDIQLFQSCTNLASLTIPSSVDTIKKYAFNDCPNLTSATYQGTIAQWNAIRKERYWDKGSSLKTVHCTDGDRVI